MIFLHTMGKILTIIFSLFRFSLLMFLTSALLSSCTIHYPGQISVVPMPHSNTIVKDMAYGESKAIYILGIGGNNRMSLEHEAKVQMMRLKPLRNGEFYQNVSVSARKSNFLFFVEHRVLVTADIIEADTNFKRSYAPHFFVKAPLYGDTNRFYINRPSFGYFKDGIYFLPCEIFKTVQGHHKAVFHNSRTGALQIKWIPKQNLFQTSPIPDSLNNGKFQIGQKVIVEKEKEFDDPVDYRAGTVLGWSRKRVLLKSMSNVLFTARWGEVKTKE